MGPLGLVQNRVGVIRELFIWIKRVRLIRVYQLIGLNVNYDN